jgi:hypothetical protein
MLGNARRGEISLWRPSAAGFSPAAAPFPRRPRRRSRLRQPVVLGWVLLLRLLVLVRLEQIRCVKERAFFLTNVDEGGLNTGKHRLDSAQVDVTYRTPVVGTIHEQLYESVIFQDGHAGFALASVDQDLTLQV